LQKKRDNGQLSADDFVLMKAAYNQNGLSIFTMLAGTIHSEVTVSGFGNPPGFFVAEPRDLQTVFVESHPYHFDLVLS
jgi:hypothetical protein